MSGVNNGNMMATGGKLASINNGVQSGRLVQFTTLQDLITSLSLSIQVCFIMPGRVLSNIFQLVLRCTFFMLSLDFLYM